VIETTKGRVLVELDDIAAPTSADRVRTLARQGVYDGRTFFRVIDNFMDQTGDPLDNGTGGSKLPNLPPEFSFRFGSDLTFTPVTKKDSLDAGFLGSLPVISQPIALGALTADGKVAAYASFCPGVAGMARADAPDTANSQFYLMRGLNPNLDEKYAVWGRVISGMDVVKAIKAGVKVALGTDAAVYPHGQNAHEFELMVGAGMPPMFTIQAATTHAAQLLKHEKDLGSITPGKYADVVAVNGNPLDDITLLQHVQFVMKEGKVYKMNGEEQTPVADATPAPSQAQGEELIGY